MASSASVSVNNWLGFSGQLGITAVQQLGSVSGALVVDLAKGSSVLATITGATTLSFTNYSPSNKSQRVVLTLTNGGTNITWPVSTRWVGAGSAGSAPSLAVSGVDKVVIDITNDNGSVIYDGAYIGRLA